MSFFRSLTRVFAPGTAAKQDARDANAVGRVNQHLQNYLKARDNRNTAEVARMNRWIADTQNRKLARQAAEAARLVGERYQQDVKQARGSAAAQADAAFREGHAAANLSAVPVTQALESAARQAYAAHSESDQGREGLARGLKAAQDATIQGDYSSQMLDLDYSTNVFTEVKHQGTGFVGDLVRGFAAGYTKGASLMFDGALGNQQTSAQAAEVMQKSFDGLYGSGVKRYNPPPIIDAQAVYGLAMGAYEAFSKKPTGPYSKTERPAKTTPTPRKYR